jgi:hypothetical protein
MKRQTKAQKCRDLGNAIIQMRKGEKIRRIGAKDGSVPTHPVVPVDPTKSEKAVLAMCLSWLRKHHVMCNRHDAATFQNDRGQWGTYGILGSGDIHGIFRYHDGKHFEVECKRGKGGRLSKDQQKRKRNVEYNNGLYFVVHGVEELIYYMGEWV